MQLPWDVDGGGVEELEGRLEAQSGKGCGDFLADHLPDRFMGWLRGLVGLLGGWAVLRVLFAHLWA